MKHDTTLRPIPPSAGPLAALLPSWQRSLRARNCTRDTISTYLQAAVRLDKYLARHDVDDPAAVTKEHLEGWLVELVNGGASATASNRWRGAKQLLKWLAAEGEIPADPSVGMAPPKVHDKPIDVLAPDEVRRLLGGVAGATFEDVRDRAIIRLFYDSGLRLDGLLGLYVDDVGLDDQVARIRLKGGDEHVVPFGARTAEALDRYLRVRRRHRFASLPDLWLHRRGTMSASGVQTMLRRLGERTGVGHVHPHMFRHTAAHQLKDRGASDDVVMAIFGWKDPSMAQRYGRSVAQQRARDAHRRLSPGDDL